MPVEVVALTSEFLSNCVASEYGLNEIRNQN